VRGKGVREKGVRALYEKGVRALYHSKRLEPHY
jgi:hypothetical protein